MGTLSRLANAAKNPFLAVARAYNKTAEKNPLRTGLITTLLKTSAADAFAQKVGRAAGAAAATCQSAGADHRRRARRWWKAATS